MQSTNMHCDQKGIQLTQPTKSTRIIIRAGMQLNLLWLEPRLSISVRDEASLLSFILECSTMFDTHIFYSKWCFTFSNSGPIPPYWSHYALVDLSMTKLSLPAPWAPWGQGPGLPRYCLPSRCSHVVKLPSRDLSERFLCKFKSSDLPVWASHQFWRTAGWTWVPSSGQIPQDLSSILLKFFILPWIFHQFAEQNPGLVGPPPPIFAVLPRLPGPPGIIGGVFQLKINDKLPMFFSKKVPISLYHTSMIIVWYFYDSFGRGPFVNPLDDSNNTQISYKFLMWQQRSTPDPFLRI